MSASLRACVCVRVFVCPRVCPCVFMCTVSRWLCVCGQPGGTVPLHLRDSFYLPGTLTGKTTSSHSLYVSLTQHTPTHTRDHIILYLQVHLHTCACLLFMLSYPFPGARVFVCLCVSVNIFDFTLCAHLWSTTLTGAMLLSLSLALSAALSPSPGAHLCWLPVASCTVNVKSCHFAQMHK